MCLRTCILWLGKTCYGSAINNGPYFCLGITQDEMNRFFVKRKFYENM
uniref:Uncharacterized protein n=1 Tax=Nelumbo nucifera TaxID=4432 RepID=A0A822ZLQ8_NELNU|nr:TPA_asm: hypothetical protein HUJ06_002635 [Nelumbo nucifera]